MEDIIMTSIVVLIGIVLFFLIFREVVCWYYKINERIDLQKQQISLLKKILYEKDFIVKPEESETQSLSKDEIEEPFNLINEAKIETEEVDLKIEKEEPDERIIASYLNEYKNELDNSIELTPEEGEIIDDFVKIEHPLGTLLVMNILTRKIAIIALEEFKNLNYSDFIVLYEW